MKDSKFKPNPAFNYMIQRYLKTQSEKEIPEKNERLLKKYKKYRKAGMNLNHKIMDKCLDRDTLNKSAKLLGMVHKGKIIVDNEDETSVLMDFALNDYRFVNKNVVEKYMEKYGWVNEIEKNIFTALSRSYTSLFTITSISMSTNTLRLKDILNKNDDITLIDIAFSSTIWDSNFLLFTRIIPFKDFNMTSGASFIFPGQKYQYLIKQYKKKITTIKSNNEAVKRFVSFYQLNKKYGIDVFYI